MSHHALFHDKQHYIYLLHCSVFRSNQLHFDNYLFYKYDDVCTVKALCLQLSISV